MKPNFIFYSLMGFCFTGCLLKVHSDYDHDISFRRYKTFGWVEKETTVMKTNPLYYSGLSDSVIKREVYIQLKNKGYIFSILHPDLIMHYHFVLENWATAVTPDPFGYLYDSYWINRMIGLGEGREGTLIIDLADPKIDLLVWRGWAVNFKGHTKPKRIQSQIKKAVRIIFRKFPDLKKSRLKQVEQSKASLRVNDQENCIFCRPFFSQAVKNRH